MKDKNTRGRRRCGCGAIMCQSKGGIPFCPHRHKRNTRGPAILSEKPVRKYHELSRDEKKTRREILRSAHKHVRPKDQKSGFRASVGRMMGR
jgi:hypothetical protein